jgi:hypothetical protein
MLRVGMDRDPCSVSYLLEDIDTCDILVNTHCD